MMGLLFTATEHAALIAEIDAYIMANCAYEKNTTLVGLLQRSCYGLRALAQQAQPEHEYVLYDEFKSRMYALLDLPVESHDNDGVGESIDYVRRDAVAAIAKRPFSPIRR